MLFQRVIRRGVVAALVIAPAMAQAQPASQIVPPSYRPDVERQGGFVLSGAPGLAAPAGAEKLFIKLSGVQVKGGLPQLAAATAALERSLLGRRVSGAEIFAAARDLEAAYASAGYVLVRVVLPPQTLVNGARLKLIVVDGFIERVEFKDVPERVRGRISELLGPLMGRRGLTLVELERRVLLAGDTPGTIMRSAFAPGKAEGAAVLVIEAQHQPVSATLTFDNTLSRALGRTVMGAGVDFNSVAGFGELVYLRASSHPDGGDNGFAEQYPRNRSLAGGIVVPLWIDGLTFNVEGTDARTTPRPTLGVQTTDVFQRLSLRLRYAWLRGRAGNFNTEVSFDAQDETQSLFVAAEPVPLSQDRLRILRVTNDGDLFTPWGAVLTGRVTASFGIDGLGARTAADATVLLPLSRQGADAAFQKVDISIGYAHTLADHLAINLAARAQTSFGQALAVSEQIGIANASGLSAFDAGSIVGDQGYVVRGEVSSPWPVPLADKPFWAVVSPYLFAAYGEVTLENPTALEAAKISATSFGAGLRLGGAVPGRLSNGSLTLEYGHANRTGGGSSDRFTIATAVRF